MGVRDRCVYVCECGWSSVAVETMQSLRLLMAMEVGRE